MSRITAGPVPDNTLLSRYRERRAYMDAYWLDVPGAATLPGYVEAFYTTPLFGLERFVLNFVGKPSSNAEARAMAQGKSSRFAAWTVEARTENDILLCDYLGRTRSWLMCVRAGDGTRLYFGSAIVPRRMTADGRAELGPAFHALLGFHRVYSRALLRAAANRLQAD
jgi:hypothetical protein